MIGMITKPIKNASNKLKDKLYDTARAGARLLYVSLPLTAYAASSDKLNEIEQMSFIKKWLANIFYSGDIQRLNEMHDYSAKGVGISGALLAGHLINRASERMFPYAENARKSAQIISYFTGANILNAVLNKAKNLPQSLEGIIGNAHDTINAAVETAQNVAQTGANTDFEYIASLAVTTLTALSGAKLLDYVARSSAIKGLASLAKTAYSHTLGHANEQYHKRRIARDRIKHARKKLAKAKREEKALNSKPLA